MTSIKIPIHEPYDWPAVLAFLDMRTMQGIDKVQDGKWFRLIVENDLSGVITVEKVADHLCLTIPSSLVTQQEFIIAQVKKVFDTEHNPAEVISLLSKEPLLRNWVQKWPGQRIPQTWNTWECLARAVVGQQISVAAARTVLSRVICATTEPAGSNDQDLNIRFPTPQEVLAHPLTNLGLTGRRAEYLHNVASALVNNDVAMVVDMPLEQRIKQLVAIKGVGEWTAQYVCMRNDGYADAFPAGDLVLQKAAGGGERLAEKALEYMAENWRPWRAYAAVYLWRSVS